MSEDDVMGARSEVKEAQTEEPAAKRTYLDAAGEREEERG
jgi:hypothetical protein